MDSLTEIQLEVLSKFYSIPRIDMDVLTDEDCNFKTPGFFEDIQDLFRKKYIKWKKDRYILTSLGKEAYEESMKE